jgi:hypothetical protein
VKWTKEEGERVEEGVFKVHTEIQNYKTQNVKI